MRFIIVSLILFSAGAFSDPSALQNTFETNYNLLQKKIEAMKSKGEKITDQSRVEMENLMAQMNHEHTELRRELERKNQQINQKLDESVKTEQDWKNRITSAYHELSTGFEKAWNKIEKGQ